MTDVRPATLGDRELLARIAAEGFYEDPVLSWALQDEATRLGQLLVVFRGMVDDMLPDRGVIHLGGSASAAFWRDPTFEDAVTASDRLVAEEAAGSEGPGPFRDDEMARFGILGAAMHEAHPKDPHWYLNVVSTLPDRQGRGLGAAVLQPVLERADAEGVPATSSRPTRGTAPSTTARASWTWTRSTSPVGRPCSRCGVILDLETDRSAAPNRPAPTMAGLWHRSRVMRSSTSPSWLGCS